MNMMTPVTGPTPPATFPVGPVRPVAPSSGAAGTATDNDRQPGEREERSSETTLRYKFDWLLQRQVSAGALSSDKAAEMIRLFERTLAGGDDERGPPAADAGEPDDAPAPSRDATVDDPDAVATLVEQMRSQFGTEGPYDDTGSPSASMPVGLVVNSRA